MSTGLATRPVFTEEEYFQLLEHSDEKWEFFEGEVYAWEAMAGTTDPHARVAGNIQRELDNRLIAKKSRCTPLGSDALLWLPRSKQYRFPDVTVMCAPPDSGGKRLGHRNPTVLVEVVSDSSRKADYGAKFHRYRHVPTLRDYLIVEQDYPLVTVRSRVDATSAWTTEVYCAPGGHVRIPSLDVAIPLEEIYRDIVWTPEGAELLPGNGPGLIPPLEDDDREALTPPSA